MNFSSAWPRFRRYRSFTLVEILVSIAVLSLIIVAMAQMTALVGNAWGMGSSRIDNFTKSRAMLDLMIQDLQRGVFREDLPAFLTGASQTSTNGATYFLGGSYTNAFYTRVAGYNPAGSPVRDLSLVSYALSSSGQGSDKIVLQRSELPGPWSSSSATNLAFGNDANLAALEQNAVTQTASPGVVGFQIMFQRQDGSVIPASSYVGEDFTHGPVVAFGVAIAVVGKQALTEMTSAQVVNLAATIAGINSYTNSAKACWDANIGGSTFSQYPKNLSTSFQTYERWMACQPF
jgi:hypothetical protein